MVKIKLKISLDILNELITNSVNPKVAMELLNNTYEAPDIQEKAYHTGKDEVMTLSHFDRWKNKVHFTTPMYKWYKENSEDWEYKQTTNHTIKKECGVNRDDMSLDSWLVYAKEYNVRLIDLTSEDLEKLSDTRDGVIVDQEMIPSKG